MVGETLVYVHLLCSSKVPAEALAAPSTCFSLFKSSSHCSTLHQPSPGPGHTCSHLHRKKELDKEIWTATSAHSLVAVPGRALGIHHICRTLPGVVGSLGRDLPEFPHGSVFKPLPLTAIPVNCPLSMYSSSLSSILESLKGEELKMKRHCVLHLSLISGRNVFPIVADFSRLQTELG